MVLRPLADWKVQLLSMGMVERRNEQWLSGCCQGCSLRLTGTRGLVGEGGVEGVVDASCVRPL